MTPRRRNPENKALPERWRFKHGAYYFRVPAGQESRWDGKTEFRLGKSIHEAYRTFASRVEPGNSIRTMAQLFDRYTIDVLPKNKPKAQESKRLAIRRLRPVFGSMPLEEVLPMHAYRYIDLVTRKHGAASANRDFEVLSHAMSMAVTWGVLERNKLKHQVVKNKIERRERYVEDWEIEAALTVAHPTIAAYIGVKLLTGLRRGDLLRLSSDQLLEDGILVKTGKTGAGLLIEWTQELRQAVDKAIAIRPVQHVPWIFCTRNGDRYIKDDGSANAFDSLWQRFMRKVLAKTEVKERFQEKDLRKKTASEMSIELAQRLLGHASSDTTRRHYRLLPEKVTPHSIQKKRR